MMERARRCPSPVELERAFWERDAGVRVHVQGCPHCQPHWDDISALAAACSDLAAEPTPESTRRDEIRAQLRSRPLDTHDKAASARLRALAPPLASAAAVALAWWLWPADQSAPTRAQASAESRVTLLEHEGARFVRVGAQADEIIRLIDGTLTVDVAPLQAGERFRVITGDAEIEGDGTTFDIMAARDRLLAVRVVQGAVEVRADRSEPKVVIAGHTWTASLTSAGDPPAEDLAARDPVPAVVEPGPERRGRHLPRDPPAEPGPETAINTTSDAGMDALPARRPGRELFQKGWQLLRNGQFLQAAETLDYAALLAPNPGDAEDARFWQAVALARGGADKRATQALTDFVDAFPESVHAGEASVMLGWLLFERAAFDEAKLRFEAADKDPAERVRASAAEGLRAVEKVHDTR